MDDHTRAALYRSQVIDLTTTGNRTGELRRIEIVMHHKDGRLFISGKPFPRKRAWLRNVEADPHVTIHLKQTLSVDVPARAVPIEDAAARRPLIEHAAATWGRDDVELMMAQSPLIELIVEE